MPILTFKKLILIFLSLSLLGCNALEGRRTSPLKSTQAINSTSGDPTLNKLASDCAAQKGRLAKAGTICLVKKTVPLPPPSSIQSGVNEISIEENFMSGMFVVATGNAGPSGSAVDLTFANRAYLKIPARVLANFPAQPQTGRLAFYLNTNDWKDVSVTVWTCYERSMQNRVYCSAQYIP